MRKRPWWRSKWWTPAVSVFLGLIMLAAFSLGGELVDGLKALGVMAALAAVFAFGSRSDTVAGLGGPGRDERWAMIDTRATAFAGLVLIVVILGAWLYEVVRDGDGRPYLQLGAVAAVAYLAAIAWMRWRS